MILGEDRLKNKHVYGVGINDANYKVTIEEEAPKVNGKRKKNLFGGVHFTIDGQLC